MKGNDAMYPAALQDGLTDQSFVNHGASIKTAMATQFLAAMLANPAACPQIGGPSHIIMAKLAENADDYADILINQLNGLK